MWNEDVRRINSSKNILLACYTTSFNVLVLRIRQGPKPSKLSLAQVLAFWYCGIKLDLKLGLNPSLF